MAATAALVGGTGLVGTHILSILLSSPSVTTLHILARRQPTSLASSANPKCRSFIEADTSKWAPYLASQSPAPQIFFSSLATTRAAAGGFENQYKIEHDLNVELAKAAKEAGTKVYILISANGASTTSMMGYSKMKGQIEEDVKALDFEHTVIVRPGLISGRREETRYLEAVARGAAALAGKVNEKWLKDPWAQDADVIARAAVSAGLKAASGEVKEKVWIVQQADIVKLGRKEWKEG